MTYGLSFSLYLVTSTIKSIFLFAVRSFLKASFIAYLTVLWTDVNDFVLVSSKVAPTAYAI